MKLDLSKAKYTFFKYFWVILLSPKPLQFVLILSILTLLLIEKKKIKFDLISSTLIIYSTIHLVSIFYRMLVTQSYDRSGAALNTALLALLTGLYYIILKEEELDYNLIEKFMYKNMLFILFLCLLFVIQYYSPLTIFNSFMGRSLYRDDWLNGVRTLRFRGFLEFDTLVPIFILIVGPWAFNYVYKMKPKIYSFLFLTSFFIPVYFSNSRMGIVVISFIIFVTMFVIIESKKIRYSLIIITMLGFVFFVIVNYDMLIHFLEELFYSRSGSNSTRFRIYSTSIDLTLNESPIIGMGIKYFLGDYPLGSHSSYIGFFYKTGLLGTFIVSVFIITSLLRCIRLILSGLTSEKVHGIFMFGIFLCMITLDIDGANWLMIAFGINLSIITKMSLKANGMRNIFSKKKLHLKYL